MRFLNSNFVGRDSHQGCEIQNSAHYGEYVTIAVRDTGTGIAPDALARVFEPFFTTKEVGKGSGLGLSMVYGFARQSGGTATIYSELGHGTEVRIYLPRAGDGVALPAPPTMADGLVAGRGERILVVEDKPGVRQTAVQLVRGLGYRCEAVADAEAAFALLDAGERYDLLFTDVIMPGRMTGIDLTRLARHLDPRMAIVFTSGFSNPEATIAQAAALNATVLSKPYRKAALAAHLRGALVARGEAVAGS